MNPIALATAYRTAPDYMMYEGRARVSVLGRLLGWSIVLQEKKEGIQ
jgi:hypothetical protein